MTRLISSESLEKYFLSLGTWWIAFFSIYLIGTGAGRVFGVVAPVGMAVPSSLAAAGLVWWTLQLPWKVWLCSLVSLALMGLVAITAALMCRDPSFHGQAIHLPAALEIATGLNPFTTRPTGYFQSIYPNGLWTLQALFLSLTWGLEEGKAPAWLLACSGVVLFTLALRTLRGGWTPAVVVAAVLALANPVMLLQLTSFELDGVVYALVLCAMAGAVMLTTRHRRAGLVVVAGACLLLINTKITGLYWAGVMVAGVLLQEILRTRTLPAAVAATLGTTLLLSIFLVGWRPYVTVPLETGKVFGTTVEVAGGPPNVRAADPFTKMSYLLLGKSSNPVGDTAAQLKLPWQWSASEFQNVFDVRIGGFGPAFGLQVLGALLAGAAAVHASRRSWHKDNAWLGLFWPALILLATLAFPVSWWARLVAPAWLLGVLPLALRTKADDEAEPAASSRYALYVGWVLALIGFAANGIATASTLSAVGAHNAGVTRILADVADQGGVIRIVTLNPDREADQTYVTWQQRLIRAGIYPRVGDAAGCRQPLFATASVQLCLDGGF